MFGRETFSHVRDAAEAVQRAQEDLGELRSLISDAPRTVQHAMHAHLEPVTAETLDTLSTWKTAGQAVTIASYAVAAGFLVLCAVAAYTVLTDR